MDSKKSNKIREIVRLQQILKKWKKLANAPKTTATGGAAPTLTSSSSTSSLPSITTTSGSKSIKFFKRTLSFTDVSNTNNNTHNDVVPKGFLAVCVGKELKRFIIPTEYLGHQAFRILLQEAEEEFGFQNSGVLKIPCEVRVFEKILKLVEEKREVIFLHDQFGFNNAAEINNNICSSPISDCEITSNSIHPQMCR